MAPVRGTSEGGIQHREMMAHTIREESKGGGTALHYTYPPHPRTKKPTEKRQMIHLLLALQTSLHRDALSPTTVADGGWSAASLEVTAGLSAVESCSRHDLPTCIPSLYVIQVGLPLHTTHFADLHTRDSDHLLRGAVIHVVFP